MKRFISWIVKIFTHNLCDTCGFTKEQVFVTELYMEAGLIQCQKCIDKTNTQTAQT